MESFHWDNNFETGLSEIDKQHHYLVNLINKFGTLLADNKIAFDYMEEVFTELASYAQYHFQEEETLMNQIGVDPRHIDTHRKEHQDFLNEVVSMHSGISKDHSETASHLLDFLVHWLAYHILGQDQNMSRQIESIRSGFTPEQAYTKEERVRNKATEPLLYALNELFHQVSSRNRELIQVNQSLEEKVAQRTNELTELNLQLEEISSTDVLTGLPNRRHAMRRLASLWEESTTMNLPLVCMMVDADHFKEVNDAYGHDAGDQVLIELSKTLSNSFRNDDVVCRLGGDEFLIICPNTDNDSGMYIAELTRKTVSELRVSTGGEPWHGSISVGVAAHTPEMKHYEELMKAADKGLYLAKEDGKNCVRSLG